MQSICKRTNMPKFNYMGGKIWLGSKGTGSVANMGLGLESFLTSDLKTLQWFISMH